MIARRSFLSLVGATPLAAFAAGAVARAKDVGALAFGETSFGQMSAAYAAPLRAHVTDAVDVAHHVVPSPKRSRILAESREPAADAASRTTPADGIDPPPQDVLVACDEGLTAWSASFDRVIVHEAANGGRLLTVVRQNETVFQRLLDRDQARHLASRLIDLGASA